MRKKILTFLLALVTSVGMMYAWTSGDCTVTLNAGVVTVSGTGAMGNYTYFTQTPWYSSRNSITSIIIEDGVTNVGDYAFARLDNLQSVVIGNNVVTIGSHAFEQCGSSFTSLTLGNSIVEIGEQAFINNSRITSINLPNTLQTIGEDAFYGCTKISSLTIPSSVTSIGDYAFGGCSLIAYIIAEPTTPPSTEENTFISIVTPSYIPLYVPNGSVADYTAAERWNTFNIQGYDPSTGPTIEPVPATPDQLSGAFTINGDGDQINFSKGNLQYVGSWQFAENQWNIIGNDQADNNRDLFGWGTGDAPNKVSTTLADYAVYHEWGTNMGDGWYTLSKDEWTYLFQSRTNAANLYAPAKVNGVNGFVILPDEFTLPSGLSFTAGVTNYGTNFYANAAWRAMENAGAVFLPVAGYRYNGNVNWQGQSGFYWSSTVASAGASAWSWLISASDGARRDYYNLFYGMPVRLVKAVDKPDQDYADPVIALINAIGTVEYTQACKDKIDAARAAYDLLTDAQKALVSNYSTLTDAEAAYAALAPAPATDGSLPGAFTINAAGDQIKFSKGNLQYVGSWQFAANQWSIIGNAQADDNRDLFGWGTGDAPNKVSMTLADYAEYHEWGTNMGDGWYTLDYDEWKYIFQTRANASDKYAPANVNGVNGFVVLPDEWVQPYGTTFTPGVTNYGTNVYADAAWTSMEDAGAVFLPVAGYRYNGNVNWQGQSGFYWSSTVASAGASAWSWLISASDGARRDYYNLFYGMPVRLVKAVDKPDQDYADPVIALINAIGTVEYTQACKDKIDAARAAYDLLTDAQKALVSNYSTLTDAEAAYAALAPQPVSGDVLPGAFTVDGDGKQINFSKTNLQYVGGAWQFAENQWDVIGESQTDGNRDLFGWGTGDAPNKVSEDNGDYATFNDWGDNLEGGWRTLTKQEWRYLFDDRETSCTVNNVSNARRTQATINTDGTAVHGVILFPDGYAGGTPAGVTWGTINAGSNWSTTCTTAGWAALEAAGCVFLPAAGQRSADNVANVDVRGFYWSSSLYDWTVGQVCGVAFNQGNCSAWYEDDPNNGFSVRLVKDASSAPAPTAVVIGDPNDASQVETFLTTYDGQTVPELTINRPVKNNMYNTLCLPFHMDADQIANSSLNGVEIYEFTDASVVNDELYLYTSEQKHEIVAGRPYLVKYSAASQLDDLDFVNVVVNNADLDAQKVVINGVTFKGTFAPYLMEAQSDLNLHGGYLFLGQNNTLYWPNVSNYIKPFRAYFYVNVNDAPAGMPMRRGMPAHIGGPAQIPTGVGQVSQEPRANSQKVMENGVLYIIKNDVKYNVQGQIVK